MACYLTSKLVGFFNENVKIILVNQYKTCFTQLLLSKLKYCSFLFIFVGMNLIKLLIPLNFFVLAILLMYNSVGGCQIVSGDSRTDKDSKKEKIKTKISRDSLTGTTYYLTGMYTYSYRSFVDNSVYGSYSDWESQKADHSGGVTVGLVLPLNKGFSLDLGFTYFGEKEKFDYNEPNSDSTFHFSQSYMQIGIPLKLRYTYGDKLQLFCFGGVTPLNLLNVRYKESYSNSSGIQSENETELIKDKLSIFNVMTTAGVGLTYNFDWVGLTLYPEFRYHLLNTYDVKAKPIEHKLYSLGVNFGLTLRL